MAKSTISGQNLSIGTDSCHSRGAGINYIYKPKFPPTAVAKLLQYSGSRIEDKDGFSSHK